MIGHRFQHYIPEADERTPFERLLELFLELMVYTSGDVDEAFRWMKEIDDEHGITTPQYTLKDFRKELEEKS